MAAAGCTGDDRELRMRMVQEQIIDRGVTNRAVVAAMQKVPRHEFVPARWRPLAYSDRPLPIGKGQTISQPYIVAYMTAALARPMAPRPNWMTRVMPGVVPAVGQGFNEKAADLAATSQYSFRQEWRTDAGDNFGAIPRSTRPIAKSHFRNGRAGWSSPPQNCPENCGGAVSHRALPTAHYRKGIMATGLGIRLYLIASPRQFHIPNVEKSDVPPLLPVECGALTPATLTHCSNVECRDVTLRSHYNC